MVSKPKAVVLGLFQPAALGLMLFLAAGTVNYWQAWLFLAVIVLMTSMFTGYLLRSHPAALRRRMRSGPTAETRKAQKVLIAGWYLTLAAMFLVSVFDHRLAWSSVPAAVSLIGDVLVAGGLVVVGLVVIQNSYAAATVRVEAGQELASSGLYGLVRHPMYTGNVITMAGIPLALGSYWGLVLVVPGVFVLGLRIRDEEKMLHEELDGYREYTRKVRYRLVPGVW